jgi:hypothetical protein
MVFLSILPSIPTDVTIFILVMISILAVELASPVFPPIPAILGDDTPSQTQREQQAKQNRRSSIHSESPSDHLFFGRFVASEEASFDVLLFAQAPRILSMVS